MIDPQFSRPFGTRLSRPARPKVETLGYSQMSLRDKTLQVGAIGWTGDSDPSGVG